MSSRELFFIKLNVAIKEKKKTNFADVITGIPFNYDYDDDVLKIEFKTICASPELGYVTGDINQYEINMSEYCKITQSNSAFNERTQEFYFEKEDGDYFVVIFGC